MLVTVENSIIRQDSVRKSMISSVVVVSVTYVD